MRKRSDLSKMSTREVLEYLFNEQEKEANNKAQMYKWDSEGDSCDDCTQYDGQMFSLDNAPTTHPNCDCQLVANIDDEEEIVSVEDLTKQKYEDRKNYVLGPLSGQHESGGNPAAIGYDKTGGYSYGTYQIETKNGTMIDYIKYLKQKPGYKKFATQLENVGGYEAAKIKAPSFVSKWKELAQNSKFVNSQKDFIVDKKLGRVLRAIKDVRGLNLENRHPVVKDALYSAAVNHGKAYLIAKDALGGQDASNMSDREILTRIYNSRANYVNGLTEMEPNKKRAMIHNRFPNELDDALKALIK